MTAAAPGGDTCVLRSYTVGFRPCGAPAVYELRVGDGQWKPLCPDHTALVRGWPGADSCTTGTGADTAAGRAHLHVHRRPEGHPRPLVQLPAYLQGRDHGRRHLAGGDPPMTDDVLNLTADDLLALEECKRLISEFLEASPEGFLESDLQAAFQAVEEMMIAATMIEVWRSGAAKFSWHDGEIRIRRAKQSCAALDGEQQ